MQQTSAIWKQLWAAGAPVEARAVIAGTVYTDISAPVITRAAMQNALSIGNVAAASLALTIRSAGNIPRSAAVGVEARLNDGVTASEWLPQGTFYISRRARDPVTGALALECYDALLKAQAVVTELPWTTKDGTPITTAGGDRILFRAAPVGDMGRLAKDMALLLGLRVDPRSVIRSGAPYEITSPNEGATIRDILSIIAQANGGNWIVTPQNQLRLVPVADVAGAAGATGDAVDVDGVTGGIRISAAEAITGLRGTLENDTWLIGDDTGLVLDVGVTPVIATELAEAMIGRRCQAYSLEGAVCDPAAELGDFVRAGANGEVASALYSQQITLGPACRSDMASPGGGEITDEYPYIGSAAKTLALARATVKEAVNRLDNALTQQEIFNRLTDNGAAQGLVMYNGQLYVNASYIQSGTLTLGGVNNQNGVLNVVDASGNSIGSWTKDGIVATLGYIGNWQILSDAIQLSRDVTSTRRVLAYLGHAGFMYRYLNNGANYLRTIFIDDRITLTDDVLGLGARLAVEPNSDSDGVDLIIQTSSAGEETPAEWTNALVIGRDRTRAGCFESDSFIVPDANGNVVGRWTKDGISANSGKIGGISFGSGNYGGLQYSYSGILAYLGPSGVIYRKLVSGDYRSVTIDPDIEISIGDAHVRLSIHEDTGDNDVELKVQTSLDGGVTWTDALLVGNNAISAPGMASGTFATADGKTVTVENGFITDIS